MHQQALLAAVIATAAASIPAMAASPDAGDIPAHFVRPIEQNDYIRREVMVPMRDGVKLYTVIVIPKAAHRAPMVLTRTPYDAHDEAASSNSPLMSEALWPADREMVDAGFIRVYQDVRGKFRSEGTYEMTRPPIGPLNTSKTDDTTDAWDTTDWLVKNVPQSNGRVGMIGSSYEGWTVVMALLHPHPALRAAVPESPMVDTWMGDDSFHYGAFRIKNLDFLAYETEAKTNGSGVPRRQYDDYSTFLAAGPVAEYARRAGFGQLPWWNKMLAHPAYDAFWQAQALDRLIAERPSDVPTLWEQGMWDQEDMWGANHSFAALKAAGHESNNWLVIGPWAHSQVNRTGYSLGPFQWRGDTSEQFRAEMVLPFFKHYLEDGPDHALSRVTFYDPSLNRWDHLADWPLAQSTTPLYLTADNGLSFDPPSQSGSDRYVSDPSKPVPFEPRPVNLRDRDTWRTWLVNDQRFVDGRPDVLTYQTPVLTTPVKLAGAPVADIVESISGSDADVVVKLIDVLPGENPVQPKLGGYQLSIATDILRGRYRKSFSHPEPIPAGVSQHYRFTLPNVDYTFKPGHRIMVQIQSTLFPLYDRNPQTFVANPYDIKNSDYRTATITVMHTPQEASAVWLPVVK
ncbi:CocE/NonD family hydrolase [Gluconobacter sp. AC10]|uniref:CocE/NonD family hydrolase n=2 Tax=Gluconobacter aidae TaxID=2662454 RepID=A0A7X1SQE9_9PROT|nr:CocE/NonD family hydrolase [Gluconobacter aidae]